MPWRKGTPPPNATISLSSATWILGVDWAKYTSGSLTQTQPTTWGLLGSVTSRIFTPAPLKEPQYI